MVITHICTLPTRVGFDILLQQLNDLSLDTPNASEVLGNFIARAVADDCLPPSYVQNHQNLKEKQAMLVVNYTDRVFDRCINNAIDFIDYHGLKLCLCDLLYCGKKDVFFRLSLLIQPTIHYLKLQCCVFILYHFRIILHWYSEALKRAKILVGIRHSTAKLENIWGTSGGLQPLMQLIDKVGTNLTTCTTIAINCDLLLSW